MTVVYNERQTVDGERNIIISSKVEWENTYRYGRCYTARINMFREVTDGGCTMMVGMPQLDGPTVVLLRPETGRRSKKRDEEAVRMAKALFPDMIAERLSKGTDL